MNITLIDALQVLDSRGNPTVQVDIILEDGSQGSFQVPSGASTGIHEAHELRDGDDSIYAGKSVFKAIDNIKEIRSKLYDIDFTQKILDEKLNEIDGTANKEVLGANAILGISCAFARASAKFYNLALHEYLYRLTNDIKFSNKTNQKLPEVYQFANIINGGLHAANKLQVQEFMIISLEKTFEKRTQSICEIYHILKKLIAKKYGGESTAVGDEGGFAPNISTPKEALDLLDKAVEESGYKQTIAYALDAAASDFYNKETKEYQLEQGKKIDYKELTNKYNEMIENYQLISIEDPFDEDDFEGFKYFRENVVKLKKVNPLTNKKELLIVGDDLLVTNTLRIQKAQEMNLCNSLLLKINQIGTLTQSIEAHKLSKSKKWHTVVSHRSGETTDDFISDLAIALESSIKLGAPARGERTAKYNRLLNIYYKNQ